MDKLRRMVRTVRHLKSIQIVWQLLNRIRRIVPYALSPADEFIAGAPESPVHYFPPPPIPSSGAGTDAFTLEFIHQENPVGWPPRWNDPATDKLWRYNLHYFEWLWTLDYAHAKEAAAHWIGACTSGRGGDGWEAYPASLRIMNWIGFFFGKYHAETLSDAAFTEMLLRSLSAQAGWLSRHVEYHLLGNHLFENAAALLYAGSCLRGGNTEAWRLLGAELLTKEMAEQIPADGMHFERSPMYHSRILYVLLMLHGAAGPRVRKRIGAAVSRMLGALRKTVHPDGDIALLNDSAFGIYPRSETLFGYARESGFNVPDAPAGVWSLPDAGYYGYRGKDGTFLVCDAGEIGPDYIPGHAHADIFTYELSLGGRRVVVDSGVYNYEANEMRSYCRSTRAHNTVEIDGFDQCEMWGAFRVAERGRPRDIEFRETDDGFRLCGWHDGYRRLPGNPVHRREFEWSVTGRLAVTDRVESGEWVRAISRIHLHPDCRIEERSDTGVVIVSGGVRFRVTFSGEGGFRVEDSSYCPEFNTKHQNITLAYSFSGKRAEAGYLIESME